MKRITLYLSLAFDFLTLLLTSFCMEFKEGRERERGESSLLFAVGTRQTVVRAEREGPRRHDLLKPNSMEGHSRETRLAKAKIITENWQECIVLA